MTREDKIATLQYIWLEQVQDQTPEKNWENPKSFVKWGMGKIKSEKDVLILKNPDAPAYHWNLKFAKNEKEPVLENEENQENEEQENEPEEKRKRGRPRKED